MSPTIFFYSKVLHILHVGADIPIAIRRCIIHIQIARSSLRAVIPVAAEQSRQRGAQLNTEQYAYVFVSYLARACFIQPAYALHSQRAHRARGRRESECEETPHYSHTKSPPQPESRYSSSRRAEPHANRS